jgi:hypothetical protein
MFDKSSNISCDTLTTNELVLKSAYVGIFDVSGSIVVGQNVSVGGTLSVSGNANLQTVNVETLNILGQTNLDGNTFIGGSLTTELDLISNHDVTIAGNLNIKDNFNFSTHSLTKTHFMSCDVSGLGINIEYPRATFDVYGDCVNGLSVQSDGLECHSILAANRRDKRIEVDVSSNDGTPGAPYLQDGTIVTMQFTGGSGYADDVYSTPPVYGNATISYVASRSNAPVGDLMIDSPNTIMTQSPLIVNTANNMRPLNESVVIRDSAVGPYWNDVYKNPAATMGQGITILASPSETVDTYVSNNSHLNFMSYANKTTWNSGTNSWEYVVSKRGGTVGGGAYPLDGTRGMASMGVLDICGAYYPSQLVVAGKVANRYLTTTGFNKFKPLTESYVVDINGPVRIDNGDIQPVLVMPIQATELVPAISGLSNYVAYGASPDVAGSYSYVSSATGLAKTGYRSIVYSSTDSGVTWSNTILYPVDVSGAQNRVVKGTLRGAASYVDPASNFFKFVVGDAGTIAVTNGVGGWININDNTSTNFSHLALMATTNGVGVTTFNLLYSADASMCYLKSISANLNSSTINTSIGSNSPIGITSPSPSIAAGVGTITAIAQYGTKLFVGGAGLRIFDIALNGNGAISGLTPGSVFTIVNAPYTYSSIYAYSETYAIAVGYQTLLGVQYGLISIWDGTSWFTDYHFTDNEYGKNLHLTDAFIYDSMNSFIVGYNIVTNQGCIYTSTNGGYNIYSGTVTSWTKFVTPDYVVPAVSPSGKEAMLYDAPLSSIAIPNARTMLVTKTITQRSSIVAGKSGVFNVFFPNYFDRANDSVLDLVGNMNTSGSIGVNDGGELLSNNGVMNVFNAVPTVNVGLQSTAIHMGNPTGATYFHSPIDISAGTISYYRGENRFSGAVFFDGIVQMGSNGALSATNSAVSGTLTTLGNVFFQNTVQSSSSTSGTVVVSGGVGVAGNIFIGGNLNVAKTLNVVSDSSFNGRVLMTNTTASTAYTNGALVITGGVGVAGAINVRGQSNFTSDATFVGRVLNTNATASTTYGTGALVVTGGVGIGGAINVAGQSNFASDASFNGNVIVTSLTASVGKATGAIIVGGGVGVGGNVCIGSWLSVNQDARPITVVDICANAQPNAISVFNGSTNIGVGWNNAAVSTMGSNNILYGAANFGSVAAAAGSYNVGVGTRNFTGGAGSYNVGIGDSVMADSGGVTYSVGVGWEAVKQARGQLNTGIGVRALTGYTNSGMAGVGYNTGIGAYAGAYDLSGYNNTYLGANSGQINTNYATYHDSTAVGYGAVVTASNQIMLGRSSESIAVLGKMGIGTVAPAYGLDVSGTFNVCSAGLTGGNVVITSGKMGIGTVSPAYALDISSSNGVRVSNSFIFYANNATNVAEAFLWPRLSDNVMYMNYGSAGLNIRNNSSVSSMFMKSTGEVGVGTVSPLLTLDVLGSITANSGNYPNYGVVLSAKSGVSEIKLNQAGGTHYTINNSGGYLNFINSGSSGSPYQTGTTLMSIGSTGNVGIGTATPAYPLDLATNTARVNKLLVGSSSTSAGISAYTNNGVDVLLYGNNGWIRFRPKGETDATNEGYFDNNGKMQAVTFNASSDYRMKSDIVDLDDGYTVDGLRPVAYTLTRSGQKDMGFLAHEVQETFPFLVTGEKDGDQMQSMNYNGFIALLVKEIQVLKRENRELRDGLSKVLQHLNL